MIQNSLLLDPLLAKLKIIDLKFTFGINNFLN